MRPAEIKVCKDEFKQQLQNEIKTVQLLLDTCKEQMEECLKLLHAMGALDSNVEDNIYGKCN